MPSTVASDSPSALTLNPAIDHGEVRKEFRELGRARVRNFLMPASACMLYEHLQQVAWRTFLIARGQLFGTSGSMADSTEQDESEMQEFAWSGAKETFASLSDADRLFPEQADAGESARTGTAQAANALDGFFDSQCLIEFIGSVTGLDNIDRIAARCERFRCGHFAMFHAATWSADSTGARRAAFYLNLTPEWRPEWGGMLAFRSTKPDIIETWLPAFNSLDLIAFPHGHWITPVSPFATAPVFAVGARVYSRDTKLLFHHQKRTETERK